METILDLDLKESLVQVAEARLKNSRLVDALLARRVAALDAFSTTGFPGKQYEDWKYANLAPLTQQNFKVHTGATLVSEAELKAFFVPNLKAIVLVFINGAFVKQISGNEMFNAKVGSLADSAAHHELLGMHYGLIAKSDNPFTALNTALAGDGAFIYVPKGVALEVPIHILSLTDARHESAAAAMRVLIVLDENAQAKVVETHHTLGAHTSFTTSVTEIALADNALLEHTRVQNDTEKSFLVTDTAAHHGRSSTFISHVASLGGGFVRNNLTSTLDAEGGNAEFYGVYDLSGTEFADNHTLIDHAKPRCTSTELYKGILADQSTGVFNGKVLVRPDAQKTNALQTNKNILLSDEATMNAKPQLEIFADDVKCSHGAATGQLDAEALFYLRSRGIDEERARILLLKAFAAEVTEKIKIQELRDLLDAHIAARLTCERVVKA